VARATGGQSACGNASIPRKAATVSDRRDRDDQSPETYQVRERLFDIGDDYWIETDRGRKAFKVDGKVLRLRDTFEIEDPDGMTVAKMQQRRLRIRDTYKIERAGRPDATLRKALISPLRDKWTIEADDVGEISISGDIFDHEYTFEDEEGRLLAETSKRWFRLRDTYGVQVAPDADHVLILAATVAIDQMAHEDDEDEDD
jgi:uncharacterized protein YxjI